jgi:hypothetical protein
LERPYFTVLEKMKVNRSSCSGHWLPPGRLTPFDSVYVEVIFLFQEVNAVLPTATDHPTLEGKECSLMV